MSDPLTEAFAASALELVRRRPHAPWPLELAATVRLASGGPRMRVVALTDDAALCRWRADCRCHVHQSWFGIAVLDPDALAIA